MQYKYSKQKKKFTLIELIIVIVVIALLSGMALFKVSGTSKDAKVGALQRDLDALEKAATTYYTKNNTYPIGGKISITEGSLKDSLTSIGDDGLEVYQLDMDLLTPYLQRLKYTSDDYLYSIKTNTAIHKEGKIDSKDKVHHILDGSNSSGEVTPETIKTWHNVLGGSDRDEFTSVIETTDGNFVAVGYTWSTDGDFNPSKNYEDALIVKFDKDGNMLWNTVLGGMDQEKFCSVIETSDGEYLVAGYTFSIDGDFNSSNGSSDALIVNFDKNGTMIWNKVMGGSDSEQFNSIIETSDNGFVIVGDTSSTNGDFKSSKGYRDTLIVKLDKDYNMLWNNVLGGTNNGEQFTSVIETSDNSFVAVGDTSSTNGDFNSNKGNNDCLIVKFDNSGNMLWNKVMGGLGYDGFNSIIEVSDGNYVAIGYTGSTDGDFQATTGLSDSLIAKFDKDGNMLWNTVLGGADPDTFRSVTETSAGGFIVVGDTKSTDGDFTENKGSWDTLIVNFDNNGNMLWNKTLGGSDRDQFNSITKISDGGFIAVGYTKSTDGDFGVSKGDYDTLIVRFDNEGNFK